MSIKKISAILLASILCVAVFAGCQNKSSGTSESKNLEIAVDYSGDELTAFQKVVTAFEKQTGDKVNLVSYGDDSDFETKLKTRMASNDLPDIWTTHGWSVARYKNYLMTLNDQSWYSNVDESIKSVVLDSNQKIYVLPVSQMMDGLIYNKDVVSKAGIDVSKIRTWDDFTAALGKIKSTEPNVVPFESAKDNAGLFAHFAGTFYVATGAEYSLGTQLKNGTFDWDKYAPAVFNLLDSWHTKGYFNKDTTTLTEDEAKKALGAGTAAFYLYDPSAITAARTYYPNSNLGIIPLPASTSTGKVSFPIGEGACFGIWKDTKSPTEAKKFLSYLAEPDVAKQVIEATGTISALTNVTVDNTYEVNAFKTAQKQFDGDIYYDNLFDREYLPSGMWSDLSQAMDIYFNSPNSSGISQAISSLKQAYTEKIAASSSK